MATTDELEERIKKLEETILVQGDILKRILEILQQRTSEKGRLNGRC